jgi:DNA-binding HxlR family transcriptional regulator
MSLPDPEAFRASFYEPGIEKEPINILKFLRTQVVSLKEPTCDQDPVCFCPLYGLLDAIGKKWSLLIIAVLGNEGEKGFNELKSSLKGISPKTLSETLKKLEELDLVNKQIRGTSPPSVRYSLTKDGVELRGYLIPMLRWVSRRGAKEEPWCPIKI